MKCKQLDVLPVVSEGQQTVLCPACSHYFEGTCKNPNRTTEDGPCPFDGKVLPVKEVKDDE